MCHQSQCYVVGGNLWQRDELCDTKENAINASISDKSTFD